MFDEVGRPMTHRLSRMAVVWISGATSSASSLHRVFARFSVFTGAISSIDGRKPSRVSRTRLPSAASASISRVSGL